MRRIVFVVVLAAGAAAAGLVVLPRPGGSDAAGEQRAVLRLAYLVDPNLDPAYWDPDYHFQSAVFEGLLALNEELRPVPAVARSWRISPDGYEVTFELRAGVRWTDGRPVTAHDFEYAWKRLLDPRTQSPRAYALFGVSGAEAYHSCRNDCPQKRARIGVRALGARMLRVRTTVPAASFVVRVAAGGAFLPVPRRAVERYGRQWAEPGRIITNGPFRPVRRRKGRALVLARWPGWREASRVRLDRVAVRVLPDPEDRLRAFRSGDVDVVFLPPMPIGPESARFLVSYPLLTTNYLVINTAKIPDPLQRRAMALAIDRSSFVEDYPWAGTPAVRFVPPAMPGGRRLLETALLARRADISRARRLMRLVNRPVRRVTLWSTDENRPRGLRSVARGWRRLGIETEIRTRPYDDYPRLLGPPMSPSVHAALSGWNADYPSTANFLEMFTCRSANNVSGYCDPRFDARHERALSATDDGQREALERELEDMLTGREGAFPVIPVDWPAFPLLESDAVRDTFGVSPLLRFDLTRVVKDAG